MNKILFCSAEPRDKERLDSAREYNAITQAMKGHDEFQIVPGFGTTIHSLRDQILNESPTIVHFCGHGDGSGCVLLENEMGYSSPIAIMTLADLFQLRKDKIKCIILNCCNSLRQAEAIAAHVDYVVGMKQEIGQQAAIEFATGFYRELFISGNYERAFESGCVGIQFQSLPPDVQHELSGRDNGSTAGNVVAHLREDLKPELLGLRAGSSLQVQITEQAKRWSPIVLYPLQPAPYFAGRTKLLPDLTSWAIKPDDPTRVVALVAAGGTGKTALAERVLAGLPGANSFGVLVWSFYENQQTEAFLRAACDYFLGEAPKESGGLFERLQQGLRAADLPHLLILDGLELIQASGDTGRPRGELEDPLIKRFLRWLAAGHGIRAKALITSRFALADLTDWTGHGFRSIDLADLDPPAAQAVLRRWGVTGSDAILNNLAQSVHRHALTVDVLGSYLGTFHGGDPAQAPSFDPEYLTDIDPKTAKLHRVLTGYAEKLQARERDLLARLSVFPRGVGVDVIGYLIDAGGEVAATLADCGHSELLKLLERLKRLGLVFRYEVNGVASFTAHPFLRGFFEKLLSVKGPREIHEAVRSKLASGLDVRPDDYPTDPGVLDAYERLIEVTRLAGKPEQAYQLYQLGIGGYRNLAHRVGGFSLGLRITSSFAAQGSVSNVDSALSPDSRASLLNQWGLYATPLGDLVTGALCFDTCRQQAVALSNQQLTTAALMHLIKVEQLSGHFPRALQLSTELASVCARKNDVHSYGDWQVYRGAALGALGRIAEAADAFDGASRIYGGPLPSVFGLWEGEFRLLLGQHEPTLLRARSNREISCQTGSLRDVAFFDGLLARLMASTATTEARQHMAEARSFANSSGSIEAHLPCYLAAVEIARHEGNLTLAFSEALDGIHLADSCGFGQFSLDIRTELARIHLAVGEPTKAVGTSEWVLNRSEEPDCQYVWGVADSLHLLGVAHARLGDTAKARGCLHRAVEMRKSLKHPGLDETKAELLKLGDHQ